MRLLFASGEPYLPGFLGGAELSIHELARACLSRGHACEVVAKLGHGGARLRYRLWRALTGARRVGRRDLANGYPTYRAFPDDVPAAFEERLRAARPDLVLTWNALGGALADAAARAGVPAAVWSPDVTMRWAQDGAPVHPDVRVLGASTFVAERIRARGGRPAGVLRPYVDLLRPRAAVRRPEFVTLVNPQPAKGVHVALGVAALLPRRRFLFVVPPGFPRAQARRLAAERRGRRNVEVVRPGAAMAEVYARTEVLLVPSQCEDAAPRVVLEAQANGIPVVASAVGGIPEVGGDACRLLPADAPVDRWAGALEELLADPAARAEASRRSLAHAARPEFSPEAVLRQVLALAGPDGVGARGDAAS